MEEWKRKIMELLHKAKTEEQLRLIYRFMNGILK